MDRKKYMIKFDTFYGDSPCITEMPSDGFQQNSKGLKTRSSDNSEKKEKMSLNVQISENVEKLDEDLSMMPTIFILNFDDDDESENLWVRPQNNP